MSAPASAMTDKEFAEAARVSYDTLIAYEKMGFLKPVAVEKAVRYYSPDSLPIITKLITFADGTRNLRAAYQKAVREARN